MERETLKGRREVRVEVSEGEKRGEGKWMIGGKVGIKGKDVYRVGKDM